VIENLDLRPSQNPGVGTIESSAPINLSFWVNSIVLVSS